MHRGEEGTECCGMLRGISFNFFLPYMHFEKEERWKEEDATFDHMKEKETKNHNLMMIESI